MILHNDTKATWQVRVVVGKYSNMVTIEPGESIAILEHEPVRKAYAEAGYLRLERLPDKGQGGARRDLRARYGT